MGKTVSTVFGSALQPEGGARTQLNSAATMGWEHGLAAEKNSPWVIWRCLFIGLGFLSRVEDVLYLVEGLNSN
jgi:hypothetical protein